MSDKTPTQEVLRLEQLRKAYNVGKPTETEVLHGLNLSLHRSDFAALVGSSGSGKSTLLNLIGLLDRPTAGELYLLGKATRTMDDAERTASMFNAYDPGEFQLQNDTLDSFDYSNLPDNTTLNDILFEGMVLPEE